MTSFVEKQVAFKVRFGQFKIQAHTAVLVLPYVVKQFQITLRRNGMVYLSKIGGTRSARTSRGYYCCVVALMG